MSMRAIIKSDLIKEDKASITPSNPSLFGIAGDMTGYK